MTNTPKHQDAPEDIKKREAEWLALDKVIDEYIDGYEMEGEDEHGRDASYTPTEAEADMMRDCIAGLLAEDDFLATIAQVYPIRSRFAPSAGIPANAAPQEPVSAGSVARTSTDAPMSTPAVAAPYVDRSEAVNLARHLINENDFNKCTPRGVMNLCNAVMTMDEALASLRKQTAQREGEW